MTDRKFETGMYIIDKQFKIVNCNKALLNFYPDVKVGDYCYNALALSDKQCDVCPLKKDNTLFYNPVRKEWIFANASEMEYPEHGICYNIQFQLRQRLEDARQESIRDEDLTEHIIELSGGNIEACAMGGYCETGSPLAYANENLINLLGYDNIGDLK